MKRKLRHSRTSKRKDILEILQIIPVDPNWHALYEDDDGPATAPLVCFALVEVREGRKAPVQFVRPFAAHACGEIGDVEHRDGFIGLLAPCDYDRADNEIADYPDGVDADVQPNRQVAS